MTPEHCAKEVFGGSCDRQSKVLESVTSYQNPLLPSEKGFFFESRCLTESHSVVKFMVHILMHKFSAKKSYRTRATGG